MERTPEELERMREALAKKQSAEEPLSAYEQFAILLGPDAEKSSAGSVTTVAQITPRIVDITTVPGPRKMTATEHRTGLHIVDRTEEFRRSSVIISPAKKPTHQD
jgi:hypothetical protein